MLSIYRFQMSGFNALWFKISVPTLAIKILAKATAIFVPMAVPWVCRECFYRTGMNFLGE